MKTNDNGNIEQLPDREWRGWNGQWYVRRGGVTHVFAASDWLGAKLFTETGVRP